MTAKRDDLAGIDDLVAETALGRRALMRRFADWPNSLCRRRLTHPRRPIQFDALGYLVIDICMCVRSSGHDRGCMCAHGLRQS